MSLPAIQRHYSTTGGHLCLDFCNTVNGRHEIEVASHKLPTHHLVTPGTEMLYNSEELIESYTDLVEFGRQMGIVSDDEARILQAEALRRPTEAAFTLAQARALREALYRIFSAYHDGQTPWGEDVERLNLALAEAMWHARLVAGEQRFRWDWVADPLALDRLLWPIARSAADLLTSAELSRVRECEGETCGWLFMDTSKNRSRRWCSMEDCGNRAKAKRHYRRTKAKLEDM
jgi:predicted RNA-binding Zn ribbon-like protein